jgi:hypothetical protein
MKSLIIGWLVIVLFALTTFAEEGDDSATVNEERIEGKIDPSLMNQQTYRSIFAAKRREQVETADRILGLDDYAKQYKMVELLSNTLFTVRLFFATIVVMSEGYIIFFHIEQWAIVF